MNTKQRDIVSNLLRCARDLNRLSHRLGRDCDSLIAASVHPVEHDAMTDDEVVRLIHLNHTLTELEQSLAGIAQQHECALKAAVADSQNPMYDYELEVQLDCILRADDPDYDEDDDNILTSRRINLKQGASGIHDGEDHRHPGKRFPEPLNLITHCYLFYSLIEQHFDGDHRKLSLRDCTRMGALWIDVQTTQHTIVSLAF